MKESSLHSMWTPPTRQKNSSSAWKAISGSIKSGCSYFLQAGFPSLQWIAERGHRVMLDLKFYDIPQTVKLAVGQLKGKGVTFATVHGNEPIVSAAVQAGAEVKILAVTVLTSFGQEDMEGFFGVRRKVEDLVLSRARRAIDSGADGIVASGVEAGASGANWGAIS